jgi:hypothetical protein
MDGTPDGTGAVCAIWRFASVVAQSRLSLRYAFRVMDKSTVPHLPPPCAVKEAGSRDKSLKNFFGFHYLAAAH